MKTSIFKSACLVMLVLLLSSVAFGQTPSKKEIAKWFSSKEWAKGLKLSAYADIDQAEFYKQYHANPEWWNKAFAYLRDNDLQKLAPGKYPIDGDNVFITITDAPSKKLENVKWESHRNYTDIQYVISGKEKIGMIDTARATVTSSYNPANDLANYTADGKFYVADPTTMYIFFPQNAHRPNVLMDGYDVVKKAVVKVRNAK